MSRSYAQQLMSRRCSKSWSESRVTLTIGVLSRTRDDSLATAMPKGVPLSLRRLSPCTLGRSSGRTRTWVAVAQTQSPPPTQIVSGTNQWFKSSEDLVTFLDGRRCSFEHGRYDNLTVKVLEDKISTLERAEATQVTSSGINAIAKTLLPRPARRSHHDHGRLLQRGARAFICGRLSRMGIQHPVDVHRPRRRHGDGVAKGCY